MRHDCSDLHCGRSAPGLAAVRVPVGIRRCRCGDRAGGLLDQRPWRVGGFHWSAASAQCQLQMHQRADHQCLDDAAGHSRDNQPWRDARSAAGTAHPAQPVFRGPLHGHSQHGHRILVQDRRHAGGLQEVVKTASEPAPDMSCQPMDSGLLRRLLLECDAQSGPDPVRARVNGGCS